MQSISKSVNDHIKLSALHGRLHLFSMGKVKWVIRHIVLRLVILHVMILWVIIAKALVEWEISWPLMADSHIYIQMWVNTFAGIGYGFLYISLIVSAIGLMLVLVFGINIKDI